MMSGTQRINALLRGEPCDHLPIQPLVMLFAAKHVGVPYRDYCTDGRIMAESQIKFADDYQIDVLATCSDPAREVVHIAGDGSVEWFDRPTGLGAPLPHGCIFDRWRSRQALSPARRPFSRATDSSVGIIRSAIG